MPFYDIDFPALVIKLIPVRLRKAAAIRWLQCLAAPVIELYNTFYANRTANLYTLHHNAQVAYLQGALNDTFDPAGRGIYIMDGAASDPLYIYLPAESDPLPLGRRGEAAAFPNPRWLYTTAEIALSGYAFIVRVPAAVAYDVYRMRATIDKYRLPAKNHYLLQAY